MDQVKTLMETQLSERELIIYLLVESGNLSYRDLAKHLLTNHTNVRRTYESAKLKMDKMANAGMFSTPVKQVK